MRHVPLVGDVAAGTGVLAAENIEETLPVPEDFTGDGALYMLRVRGDSMIEAGIFDGDYVVVRQQPEAERRATPSSPASRASEATVKTFLRRRNKIVLRPENSTMDEMVFDPARRHDLRQGRLAPPALLTFRQPAPAPTRESLISRTGVAPRRRTGASTGARGERRAQACATPTNPASVAYA